MSAILSVRVDEGLLARYKDLATKTGRSKAYYINEVLEDNIDELEYVYGLRKMSEDYRAGRLETYSLDEVRSHCGLGN